MTKKDYEPEHLEWFPNDIESCSEVLDWLDTAPAKDHIGWITIGDEDTWKNKRVFTINHSNRQLWRDIIFQTRAYFSLLLLEEDAIFISTEH
jgi:hypothetical protein